MHGTQAPGSQHGRLSTDSSKLSKTEHGQHDSSSERRTILKLDLLLVTTMAILYLLAFLDRSNIGNARVAGLQADLGMSDHQHQIGMMRSTICDHAIC